MVKLVKRVTRGWELNDVGWLITVALLYAPIIYKMHRRIDKLEQQIQDYNKESVKNKTK